MNEIKKIVIFYFSGTGNARQIAVWLSEFAAKKSIDCQIFNIATTDQNTLNSLSKNLLVIIISPVHGFNFPKITLNFIRHFPKGKNRIVLMNTRAGMKIARFVTPGLSGISFMLSSLILRAKGYKIVGQIPFDMPSNWLSIHPALNENTVKFLYKKNYKRVEKHSNKIFSGKSDFLARRDLVQDILISPIAFGYYLVGRFAFAKSFYASVDCDNCGLCVKQCPVKAIKMANERPYWTFQCESCMQCMNICPKKAIETAHGLFVAVSLICSMLTTIILHNILKISIQSLFIKLLIFGLLFFALLWVFYKIQHLLLRNKFIGKIITLASLTHYKFWGRYYLRSKNQRQIKF
ncbi:MAG: EFR1 family ferrodoxin [Prevotellaceae bacterium]|nr:EFR1 family ferrodoxin [Prevotellaceae bacterium]